MSSIASSVIALQGGRGEFAAEMMERAAHRIRCALLQGGHGEFAAEMPAALPM